MQLEEQATEPKTEAVDTTEVQEQAQPAAQGQGSGPWTNDLASTFEDEGIRTQVDTFLRDKVQPYVTQLEQRSKPSPEDELGIQLYNDLREDPSSTYLAITEELFGEDGALAIQRALAESFGVELEDEPASAQPSGDLDPRVARAVEHIERQEAREAYDSALTELKGQDPELDEELFHPFVVAADGDIQTAYRGYKQWSDRVKSTYAPAEEGAELDVSAAAPPVIGSDVQAPTAPPVQKTYESFDDAMDDFLADVRGGAPPVVGSV